MIKSAYFEPAKPVKILTIEQIPEYKDSSKGFIWVSLECASNAEMEQILRGLFQFHPFTYLFIIAHAIKPVQDFHELLTLELNFFVGENYLVTCYTDGKMSPIDKIWGRVDKDFRLSNFGPDFLCHAILDYLVDEYMPLIDQMETEIEWLEDSVLEKPSPTTLERLITLKHSIMSLRRIISPQREMINRLSRDEFAQVDQQSRYYFRDIYDHLVRIQDLADTIRDIVSGAMDIYLNSTSLRLNEVMKALTIVSTIFLPLSFIAGLWGMNFTHIPGATLPFGFYAICVLSVLIGVGMLGYFRWRRWF
jgi:magnesium transporter